MRESLTHTALRRHQLFIADAALSIPPHPPTCPPSLSFCYCHKPFPPVVHYGHVTPLVLSGERGERVSHEGREEEKRGGEDCEGGEEGLYRKSISRFHFSHGLGETPPPPPSSSSSRSKCLYTTEIFSDENGARLNFKSVHSRLTRTNSKEIMTVSNYPSVFFFLTNVRMTSLNPSFHVSPPLIFLMVIH